MFRRLDATPATLGFTFDGQAMQGRAGDSVAAALLAAGVNEFRQTAVSGAARAPWCMMGVCFDCLVEIDGVASRQACMVKLEPGMRIRPQYGAKDVLAEAAP